MTPLQLQTELEDAMLRTPSVDARDFAANAAEYKITYIIWRQQIWNASYPERGWRWMEDRGGATANHLDHVHISVRD